MSDKDMILRQISSLLRYAAELSILTQVGMPKERHEAVMGVWDRTGRDFFNLAAGLLRDAIIQGIANLLDPSQTGINRNLTLRTLMEAESDVHKRAIAEAVMAEISNKASFDTIKIARNKLLSHSDYEFVTNYDGSSSGKWPGLTQDDLQELLRLIQDLAALLARISHTE